MKGIEIEIDNAVKTGQIEAENFTLSVTLTLRKYNGEEQISLNFSGYNRDKDQQITWVSEPLFPVGKEIKIRVVKKQETVSEPVKVFKYDETINDEMLLKSYRNLEELLKKKGLV